MLGNVHPNQITVTQKEVMKLHCSLKVYIAMVFQRDTWVERTCKRDQDECRLMSRSLPKSSRNPLNQLGPRVSFLGKLWCRVGG